MTFVQAPHEGGSGWLRGIFFGPRELRAGWRLAIFIGLFEVLILVGNALMDAVSGTHDPVSVFFRIRLVNIFSLLIAAVIMGRLEKRTMADYGLPWRRMFGTRFWQGVFVGVAAVSTMLGCMHLTGAFNINDVALHGVEAWQWAGLYVLAFAMVGIDEEFKYRGYTLFTLASGMGFWPAAGFLAVLFGVGHISNEGETWFGIVNVVLGGLVFANLLRRTGNLWLPIGVHAGWDWAQTYLYGLANSGITAPGHLFDSKFSGPVWLTGGTVGPEGSAVCTIVLIAIWITSSIRFRKARVSTSPPAQQ